MKGVIRYCLSRYLVFRMNALFKKFQKKIKKDNLVLIEYGNLRKGDLWGFSENGQIIFSFDVDVLAEKPFQYRVVYDKEKKIYYCYSRMGGKSELSNFLQFSVSRFSQLEKKLKKIVEHIPAMRERFLRQYLFNLSQKQKGKRFLFFFRSSLNKGKALYDFLENLLTEKKISPNEYERLKSYAKELV